MPSPRPPMLDAVSGAQAGFAAVLFTMPIETLQRLYSTQSGVAPGDEPKPMLAIANQVLRTSGPLGFWRGFSVQVTSRAARAARAAVPCCGGR